MMEKTPRTGVARGRSRTRADRAAPATHAPLPRLSNRWKPLEVLSPSQLERIVDAAFRILQDGGLELRSARAREACRRNGCLVDEETQVVRMGRDVVESFLRHAPERFVLHARNPARHLHVGGDVVNFGPVGGAPHVADLARGRRYGDLEAFRDIIKVTNALGVLHWQGGMVVEPVDVPIPVRHLEAYRAHVELSDLVWSSRGTGAVQSIDGIAMSAIEHGTTPEGLAARPTLLCITNVNSPRRVDEEILESVMILAEHGQCVAITPFTLMGAMAPVTLAGALAQGAAEALGIIALCQMVRPGTPCVFGAFTSNVDMRTGAPAFGTPEYVNATIASAQLARRFRLPVRASAPNASPCVDAQATWETGFSLWAAVMSHSNLVYHAAGWLEGGLSASMEKIVVDAEMLRGWAEILKPVDFTDDDIGVDAILGVPPGGHFFGTAHTLARYETAFWRPILSDWSNFENWRDAGARNATDRAAEMWPRLRDAYQPPPLDQAVREELAAYVARRREELGVR